MTHEEQLIREILDGRMDSFRGLVERYQRPVFQMIFNFIGDRHASEDLTQDVFMSAYCKLSSFDPMLSRFSTWLFAIARNKSINYLRRKRLVASLGQEVPVSSGRQGSVSENKEFIQQMDEALNRLPTRQKRAFVLSEFEKLPYDQIAQIECVSIGTVKSRIHRAKKNLQEMLKGLVGEP